MICSNTTLLLVQHELCRVQVGTFRRPVLDIDVISRQKPSSCCSRIVRGVIVHEGDIRTIALNVKKNICFKNIVDVSLGIDVSVNHS